jgi:hypothetical protein
MSIGGNVLYRPSKSIAALIPFQVAATVGSSQQLELLEV